MPQTLTISLAHPVKELRVVDAPSHEAPVGQPLQDHIPVEETKPAAPTQDLRLAKLGETLDDIVAKLTGFHRETLAQSRGDIAKLAVEIARKILKWKTDKGDYDIQAIVEETLSRAPSRQNIVIRLNPDDLSLCHQFQQDNPESALAELNLVSDWGIARANCVIETPKGIVKSSMDECLERIGQALERAQ